jgi:choline dehydrogenase
VVAGRLAENPDIDVLLLEAGANDDVPGVLMADQWATNLGSDREWGFQADPCQHVNNRSVPLPMGKVLGGGSSINGMVWARGHKTDWEFFAEAAGNETWSYPGVLDAYRRIEDWHGEPDEFYRGTGGPVYVEPVQHPSAVATAVLDGARSVGIPIFENMNGRMMEEAGGTAVADLLMQKGRRRSVFRAYVYPLMGRPNLTVLTGALVARVVISDKRATAVEFSLDGAMHSAEATEEVVLSLGAVHTPKVLMQSGIGDQSQLQQFGVPVVQHLPGVGQNYQDHPRFDCVWELVEPIPPPNNSVEAVCFWRSDPSAETPDVQIAHFNFPICSAETGARYQVPQYGWTLIGNVLRPRSRGRVLLTGPDPDDPVRVETNMLSDPHDLNTAIACVKLCREIGNSAPLRSFAQREVMPGNLDGAELERFVRDAASSSAHQTGTAKMGSDAMSVVDAQLRVYGVESLRIADASIMPRITTGNTMAPCVLIGERAGDLLCS